MPIPLVGNPEGVLDCLIRRRGIGMFGYLHLWGCIVLTAIARSVVVVEIVIGP